LSYGTAGFRNKADYLEIVALRVGVFTAVCNRLDSRKSLGVCVTASHVFLFTFYTYLTIIIFFRTQSKIMDLNKLISMVEF